MAKYIFTVFVFFGCGIFSFADEKLLNQLIQSHKEFNQYFKTVRCDVENKILFPEKKLWASGNYLKSGWVTVVNQGNEKIGMDHFLLRGREIWGVGRSNWENGVPTSFNAFRWPNSTNLIVCDAWTEMLLDFRMPDNSHATLGEFLQALKTKPSCKKITINGADFVELKAEVENVQKSRITYVYLFDGTRSRAEPGIKLTREGEIGSFS